MNPSGPFNSPFNSSPFSRPFKSAPAIQEQITKPVQSHSPDTGAPRVAQYAADSSGCGFWRLFWPEHILNANQKLQCTTTTVIDNSASFYAPMKAVRVQRQATTNKKSSSNISNSFNNNLDLD
jgi:hypothetical protein